MTSPLGILRYVGYTLLVAFVAALVFESSIRSPGGLRLTEPVPGPHSDWLTTTEYSLVENLQNGLLVFCALLFGWVALRDRLRRPLAVFFAVLFVLGLIRELDFFLDHKAADNVWQVLTVLIAVPTGVYLARQRQRLVAGWQRSWPSAGLAMVMAGLILLIAYTQVLARAELFEVTMGDRYLRAALLAFEELCELGAYLVITIGSLEFLYAWSRLPQTREMDRQRGPRRRRRSPEP